MNGELCFVIVKVRCGSCGGDLGTSERAGVGAFHFGDAAHGVTVGFEIFGLAENGGVVIESDPFKYFKYLVD